MSFGGRTPTGEEIPKLSVRQESSLTRIRFAPYWTEVKCSEFRKELCGKEDQVASAEVVVQKEHCTIVGTTLVTCNQTPLTPNEKVEVTLKDGTKIPIKDTLSKITVGELKVADPEAPGKTTTSIQITSKFGEAVPMALIL